MKVRQEATWEEERWEEAMWEEEKWEEERWGEERWEDMSTALAGDHLEESVQRARESAKILPAIYKPPLSRGVDGVSGVRAAVLPALRARVDGTVGLGAVIIPKGDVGAVRMLSKLLAERREILDGENGVDHHEDDLREGGRGPAQRM